MARITAPIVFPNDDPAPMMTHLDRWATSTLTDASTWAAMVERCGLWADYSPRNQVLLASYGIATPVAGASTWEQVPSREAGRACAVRAGEHGLPVRAPVAATVTATGSPRSRAGQRARAVVSHRWELVFAEEQLARRPALGQLAWAPVPAHLTGIGGDAAFAELVRRSVGRLTSSTPRRAGDPWARLVDVAAAVPLGARRPELRPALCRQAAWLAADRVGHAPGPIPGFDPVRLRGRLRWELLVDTRRATDQLVRAFSDVLDVDLTGSPLPRMDVQPDRTVTPGRRNYLAPADVAALPLGVWVEAGPYTAQEWAARGVPGAQGRGGFLRVSDTGYLGVYETGEGARWRIESTRSGRRGLLDEGTADTFADAQRTIARVVADRYPSLAPTVNLVLPVDAPLRVFDPSRAGWQPLAGGRDGRAQQRVLSDRVQLLVAPGPGGRWENMVIADTVVHQLPLAATEDTAKTAVELVGRRRLIAHASEVPQLADTLIADAAADRILTRELLIDVVGHRLTDDDCARLSNPDLAADALAGLLVDVGVLTPATILDVLVDAGVGVEQVAGLVPVIGMPIHDGVAALAQRYGVGRVEAGSLLGATAADMHAAGCSPAELLAAHPRETLRSLDARPHTWEVAAATMLESGTELPVVIRQLAAHAPTPECFAIGTFSICNDPLTAIACSARHAHPTDLAALADVYDLDPATTAQLLADAGTHPASAHETLTIACDGDQALVDELCRRHFNTLASTVAEQRQVDLSNVGGLRDALASPTAADAGDLAAQLAALTGPGSPLPLPSNTEL